MDQDIALSQLNEDNFECYLKAFAFNSDSFRKGQLEYHWVSSPGYDWPEFIYRVKAVGQQPEQLFSHLTDRIREKKIPTMFIIGPGSQPEDLADSMNEGPFELLDYWPGMVLETENQDLLLPEIPGFKVVQVKDETSLGIWTEIVNEIFFPKKNLDRKVFSRNLDSPIIRMFIGYLDGNPAGTSLSVFDGRSLGVYMISTKKEFRKMGVGYHMTVIPILEHQKQAGKTPVILQASNAGKSLYEKIGFRSICNFFVLRMITDTV